MWHWVPVGAVMVYRWEVQNTVLSGRRLLFDGTAIQLFGNWIKWLFLTVITLGIYAFWLDIKLKQWKVKHIRFVS